MANKVSYAKLGLKVKQEVNTFDFNGTEIEVLKYLPFADKYDLVMIALQYAYKKDTGVYDEMLLDMYFHLFLVYMYSNLSFTEKQKENEMKIYDTLASNGFLDAFLNAMEQDEYDFLVSMVTTIKDEIMQYTTTAGAVLNSLIRDLPTNAEAAAQLVNSFDPENYKMVLDMAKAVGFKEGSN